MLPDNTSWGSIEASPDNTRGGVNTWVRTVLICVARGKRQTECTAVLGTQANITPERND